MPSVKVLGEIPQKDEGSVINIIVAKVAQRLAAPASAVKVSILGSQYANSRSKIMVEVNYKPAEERTPEVLTAMSREITAELWRYFPTRSKKIVTYTVAMENFSSSDDL